MSTQISKESVNQVKEQLKDFIELILTRSVDKKHPEFYSCIRACVALFWQRKTYDYGVNGSGEIWPDDGEKPMSHEEAIQKIKEKVIPFLEQAKQQVIPLLEQEKSNLPPASQWILKFMPLYNSIQALFPKKQTAQTGPSESHRQRMRELLDELRRLLDESDV
jgi:hypothetical protein